MSRTIARLHGEWLLKRVARGKNATRSKGAPSAAGLAGGPAVVGVGGRVRLCAPVAETVLPLESLNGVFTNRLSRNG